MDPLLFIASSLSFVLLPKLIGLYSICRKSKSIGPTASKAAGGVADDLDGGAYMQLIGNTPVG
jgi:hypothetical protein